MLCDYCGTVSDLPYNIFPHAGYVRNRVSNTFLELFSVDAPTAEKLDDADLGGGDVKPTLLKTTSLSNMWHCTRKRTETLFDAVRYEAGDEFKTSEVAKNRRVLFLLDVASGAIQWSALLEQISALKDVEVALITILHSEVNVFSFSSTKPSIHAITDLEDIFVEAPACDIIVPSRDTPRWSLFVDAVTSLSSMFPQSPLECQRDFLLAGLFIGKQVVDTWGGGVEIIVADGGRRATPSSADRLRKSVFDIAPPDDATKENAASSSSNGGGEKKSKESVKWRHKPSQMKKPTSLAQNLSNLAGNLIAAKSFVTFVSLYGQRLQIFETLSQRTNGSCYYTLSDAVVSSILNPVDRVYDVTVRIRLVRGIYVSNTPSIKPKNRECNGNREGINFVPRESSVLHHSYDQRSKRQDDDDDEGFGGRTRNARRSDAQLLFEADAETLSTHYYPTFECSDTIGLPWSFDNQIQRAVTHGVDKHGYNSYNSKGVQGIEEFKIQVMAVYSKNGSRYVEVRNKKLKVGKETDCLSSLDISTFLACSTKQAQEKFGDNDVEKRKFVTDICFRLYNKYHNDGNLTSLTVILPALVLGVVKCIFFRKEKMDGRYERILERGCYLSIFKVLKPVFFKLASNGGVTCEYVAGESKEFQFMHGLFKDAAAWEQRESRRKARVIREADGIENAQSALPGEGEDDEEEDDDDEMRFDEEYNDFANLHPSYKDVNSQYYSETLLSNCLPLTRDVINDDDVVCLSDGVVTYVYYGRNYSSADGRREMSAKFERESDLFKECLAKACIDSHVVHLSGDDGAASEFFDRLILDRCGFSGGSFTLPDYEKSMKVGIGKGGNTRLLPPQRWSNYESYGGEAGAPIAPRAPQQPQFAGGPPRPPQAPPQAPPQYRPPPQAPPQYSNHPPAPPRYNQPHGY
jgi:hypothetical protein